MALDPSSRYPRSRLDKLGIAPGDRVGVVAFQDATFERELASRGATAVKGGGGAGLRIVLCAFREIGELSRLAELRAAIAPDGCVWALWPKGRRELREDDVREAGLAIGLVDVKVMAFSDVLSGLKLVIPKKLRGESAVKAKPKKRTPASSKTDRIVTAVERRRRPAQKIPDDVAAALAKRRRARAAFDALPPSHQRQHLEAIEEAKRADTRARRILKLLETLTKS